MRFNVSMYRRFVAALALTLAACGGGEALPPDSLAPATPPPTVSGVGELPDAVPTPDVVADAAVDGAPAVSVVVTRPVGDDGVMVDTVSELVNGNRVIAIGDSILASTATRYGGELCDSLTEFGWSVEVDAEPGRFVRFGNEVLAQRIAKDTPEEEDFDAAIVHLGSNYGNDRDEYYDELNDILFRLAPRPTLLLTVTEYRPAWAEVNSVIDELADLYDNVIVIDWERIARTPGVLSRDGLHPGNEGEAVLVEQLAVALGRAGTTPGECLSSSFTDDSAVRSGSSGGSTSDGSSGGSTSGGSTSGGSSSSGSSTGGSSSGGSTSGSSSSTGSSTTTVGGSTDGGTTTDGTTGGTTTGGTTTVGGTTDGSTGEPTTGGGSTDGGTTTEGTTGGTTTVGGTTDGSTGEPTTGGSTSGGTTTGETTGGATSGSTSGTTAGGTTAGGTTDEPTSGTTAGGVTTGGSSGETATGGETADGG